jgi:hypothetical protein
MSAYGSPGSVKHEPSLHPPICDPFLNLVRPIRGEDPHFEPPKDLPFNPEA